MRVIVADATIADTVGPGLMFGTGHRPVYYFPRKDVRMDLLERTEHRTHCPLQAIRVGNRTVEEVAWVYLDPLPDFLRTSGYLCFCPEKVDRIDVEGEPR